MKISRLILSAALASLFLVSNVVADTASNMTDFNQALRVAIPEACTQHNVWSNAYIGQVYPSIFPHMGFGLGLGATKLDTSGLSKAAVDIGMANKVNEKFVLPTVNIDARFGGFILPFDFGVSGMMTSPMLFGKDMRNAGDVMKNGCLEMLSYKGFFGVVDSEIWLDYLTLGADFRYRFFEGSGFIPALSLGGGYYYARGVFRVFEGDKKIGSVFENHTIFLQAQISNSGKIFSGFLGIRGLLSNNITKGTWTTDGTNYAGTSEKDVDGKFDWAGIQPQAYGGFSIDIYQVQLTFGLCCDVRSFFDKESGRYKENLVSGSFSIRYNL